MPMGWGNCLSPQNPSGVSGVNSVAAASNTIKVYCYHFFRCNKTTEKTQHASIQLVWRPQAPTFKFDSKRHKICCKWSCFESDMNCRQLDDTTQAVWRHVVFFSGVLLHLKSWSPFSNVSGSAATQFTSTTPEVLCGLKHFPHPSIG